MRQFGATGAGLLGANGQALPNASANQAGVLSRDVHSRQDCTIYENQIPNIPPIQLS